MKDSNQKTIFIVTCTYPNECGGTDGVFIHNQSIALKDNGANPVVLFYDFRSFRKKRKIGISEYVLDGVKVYRYAFPCGPFPIFLNFLEHILKNKLYNHVIKKEGIPDCFHAHFFNAGNIALMLSKKTGIPFFVTEHSSGILENNLDKRDIKKARRVYYEANCVFPVSFALAERIKEIAECNIKVIPNIIPRYFFQESLDKLKSVNNGTFIFVSVGNFIKRKRFDLLLTAFSLLVKKNSSVFLRLIGSGALETYLKELTKKLGIDSNVFFGSPLKNDEMPSVFSHSDCFVLASDFETFGMVYAEAMACGIPVIATKCGGPESFVTKDNGVLVEKNNPDELSNAMEYIMNNYYSFSRERIRDFCKKNFSSDIIAIKLINEYQRITK